jgi:outer membrane protein
MEDPLMTDQPVDETALPEQPKERKPFPIMKYLNILVLAGLVVLYILFFVQKSNQSNTVAIPAAANYMKEGGLKIAFVNSDSIKEHYQLVMDLQKNLETKFAQYDGEISRKQQLLEQQAQDLQKKYESRQISAEDAQRADEQLQAEGRKVYELNQTYSNKMAEEESKLNKVFIDSIYNFLQRYNSNNTFDYILGYSKGGGILFAKDTLDITKEVIENLNKEYLNKYPEKK